MPIISFNVSESLRNFIKKMAHTKDYKNNSNVIRDALVRLMKAKDGDLSPTELQKLAETTGQLEAMFPKITGSILLNVETRNEKLDRKINKLEVENHDSILHRSVFVVDGKKTITYVLKDTMDQIQMFITELNSIEELQAFRYTINEPED